MAFETHIARRYLRSKRSSLFVSALTLISIAGVAVGVMALIVVLSVMTGFEQQVREKIIGLNSHGQVLRETGSFPEDKEILQLVQETDGVELAAPFLSREVMIASTTRVSGVILKGIDETLDRQVIDVENMLVKDSDSDWKYMRDPKALLSLRKKKRLAEWAPLGLDPQLDTDEEKDRNKLLPPIVLGQELALFIHVETGDEVTIINPFGGGLGPGGPIPARRSFRVAGIFYSGMFEYDMKLAFTPLKEVQILASTQGTITGLELLVDDDRMYEADLIGKDIESKISARLESDKEFRNQLCQGVADDKCSNFIVKDWKKLNESLFAALKVEQLAMFIILTFITVVAAFNIASKLIMMVIEKQKEIAILKSMGAPNKSIMRIFQLEGLVIGSIGTAIGTILGLVVCALIPIVNEKYDLLDPSVYYMTKLPVDTEPLHLVIIVLSALGISWLATLLPSWKAAQLNPVDGLRED